MLKGISPLISPDLLATLCRMGHGDEILLADAHFPGHSIHPAALRADGVSILPLLDAILPLFALDTYDEAPALMMETVPGDTADPNVAASYQEALKKLAPEAPPIRKLERFAFYERAKQAYAIIVTGDTAKYANIILKKGVPI
ncbi:L-fucose mutarotase [bacterium]|nr:L-fucose mutarotase [bacterium]